MQSTHHTVSTNLRPYLDKLPNVAPIIRENADRAEREAQMPRDVANAFHESGMFRMLLPHSMGGGALTIPDSMRLVEEVSSIDGSAGWNLAICGGGPVFGHYLSRSAFDKIYGHPRGVSAGSLNPMTSQAIPVEGGYRFSGKATYASGSAHATHLVAAAIVLRDGAPQIVNDFPVLRAGVFPIEHAKILNTWSTTGMRGTGSNDCVFENVFVPDEFTFDWLFAQSPWQSGAFANIPFAIQIAGSLVPVVLGIARHAIDALKEIAQAKVPAASRSVLRERPVAQSQIAQAEGLLQAARSYFYQSGDEIWRRGEAGDSFTVADRAQVRLAVVTAVKLALQAVDIVAEVGGMNSAQTTSAIERCWRDIHTASQHVQLCSARYETVGRILLGLDPGSPLI